MSAPPPTSEMVRCDNCGHDVPAMEFCVRCGDSLVEERHAAGILQRAEYAAAPDEGVAAIRIVSTLFPQLPRADMNAFRWALAIGLITVIGLSVLGLYPVGLVASVVLVPMLMVLYLYDVDVYEDEPVRVIALTMAWGAVTGLVVGFVISALVSADTSLTLALDPGSLLTRGVVIPLIGAVVMIAGPLFLLRYRKFNDVLDGATFGAASAVSFVGGQALANGLDLFAAGFRPAGDPLPWVARLLTLGLAQPLIAAGVIGATAAAFWLQYRAPVHDRNALGPLGRPVVASVVAAAVLVAAALGQMLLTQALSMFWLTLLAIVSLLWLRWAIHIGLLQEAAEVEIGEPISCGNCGRQTASHSFCGHCGVSLRALPKERKARPTQQPQGAAK